MTVPDGHQDRGVECGGGTQHNTPVGQVNEEEPELARLVDGHRGDHHGEEVQADEPTVEQVPFRVGSALPLEVNDTVVAMGLLCLLSVAGSWAGLPGT